MTQAHYSLSTGLILATISPGLSDANQIAALNASGIGVVSIPDGKDGGSGMIDLATAQYADYAPPPPPVPDIMLQYVAAQINSGSVDVGAFHPKSIAILNAQLDSVNLAIVKKS